jgi:hypothetical protein
LAIYTTTRDKRFPIAAAGAERPKLKTLEDRDALVEVWWLSPAPFRAADRFPLRK